MTRRWDAAEARHGNFHAKVKYPKWRRGENSTATGVRRIGRVLHQALGDAETISVQNPIHLDDYAEPEPDIAILWFREDDYATHPGLEDTLVAIEVSDSSLAFDLEVKSRRYAAAGIPEMWVMNRSGDCMDRLDLPMSAGYARHTIFRRGETLRPAPLPGLELAVDDLLPPRPTGGACRV